MAQASPSWQRLLGLLSVLLALLLGASAGSHDAAVAGCPADIVLAPENTWSFEFENGTDVAESESPFVWSVAPCILTTVAAQAESSHVREPNAEVNNVEATSLHGIGARSAFEAFAIEIPASCRTPSMMSSLMELPISFASLHLHLQNIRTK
ncbi:uncharacterized protein LY79DRAFT_178951 [Colletotrichum navitas]|uniref:Uncharacterized protein n=1 Tax=Colletotrichum navitas TaxID=681940 RepID=A0AAD8Q0Y8_9PEZI|nr:uncharacterized protein LY79DRAFT_178951 [Colletotrichum navitas]KAK1593454.1 hypothetical protein LY79DRAFT_178951 [Colletotrichum navitas]